MKYCPSCQTNYADDTLQFCLQDGTQLKSYSDSSSETETPTVVFPDDDPYRTNQTPKQQQQNRINVPVENQPIFVEPSRIDQVQPIPQTQQQQTTAAAAAAAEPSKSNTARAVFLTILAMLVLFGIAGAGAWFYFKGKNNQIAQNTNSANNSARENANANNKTPTPSPTASRTPKNENNSENANTNTSAPPPADFDPEELKEEVTDAVYGWKDNAESLDLNAYMSGYAETVDYYNKKGASRAFVRADKQKAFSDFDYIKINVSNMTVTPDPTGTRATAVFDKSWIFEGADKYSEGKVQTQLNLVRAGNGWKIAGERDIKVYYSKFQ